MSDLTLTTDRLTLRRPAARDWDGARDFYMSDRSAMAGGNIHLGAAWRQFAAIIGHWDIRGYGLWAVTLKGNDTCLGLVGQWCPEDWPENELGWVLFAEAEGKSIAYEAAQATRNYAYDTLGWTTAVSYLHPDNARSITLAERLGCTRDDTAPWPYPEKPCAIYRHPAPDARP